MAEKRKYGIIEWFDARKKMGLIRAENGRSLHFSNRNLANSTNPETGMIVSFLVPSSPDSRGRIEISDVRKVENLEAFLLERKHQEEKEYLERAASEALTRKREREEAEEARKAREAEYERQQKRLEEERAAREARKLEQKRLEALAEEKQLAERQSRSVTQRIHVESPDNTFPVGSRVFFQPQGSGEVKQVKGNWVFVIFDSNGRRPIQVPANLLQKIEPEQPKPIEVSGVGVTPSAIQHPQVRIAEKRGNSPLANYLGAFHLS